MNKQTLTSKKKQKNGINYIQHDFTDNLAKTYIFDISDLSWVIKTYNETLQQYVHSNNFYCVIWFFSGGGSHIIDLKEYKIEQNSIYFLSPKQLYKCCDINKAEGIIMGFSEDFLLRLNDNLRDKIKSRLFRTTHETTHCRISVAAKEKIMPGINRLMDISLIRHKDESLQVDKIALLLALFLIDVIEIGDWSKPSIEEQSSNTQQIYQKFIQAIDAHFKKYHNVEDYLNVLGTSRTYLNICVQQYAKKTPLRLIQNRIITEAKRMLLYSTLSIKEISFDLGFKDVSYFIRLFKRIEGTTPFNFRELNKL